MNIQIDSREKARAIQKIMAEFDRQGVDHFVSKLYVGDYMNFDNPRLIIDRKQNLTELCSNVCQGHNRFRDEMLRAQEHGIRMIICASMVRVWSAWKMSSGGTIPAGIRGSGIR